MAEYTPPTDNVPIFDVTNFISSSGSGLTEAQIATKFLRFPTGQGTETLPALITGSITSPTPTTVMNIGTNLTGATALNIGATGSTNNITGITNINSSTSGDVTIGSPSLSSHTIRGNSVTLNGNTNYITGNTNITGVINLNGVGSTDASLITIGNDSATGITTLSSDTINIGNADTATTMNATNIKQVIKTVAGTLIENTVGNTSIASSMSSTFNTKVGAPAGSPLNCYTIISNTAVQYTAQYFEIIVSGSNNSRGAYTYKGCFGVEKIGTGTMTASSVSTLFYYGTGTNPPTSSAIPVIDFTLAGQTLTLRVNTSTGSTNQHFITTLIGYPTVSITTSPVLQDFIITAV